MPESPQLSRETSARSREEMSAPDLILLCLDECLGEFYYPLSPGESQSCPVDGSHRVKVYRAERVIEGHE